VGVAPVWILIHFVLNPLGYFAACLVSLFLFRPWRPNAATAFVLLGFALCGLLIYHSVTGQIWPYTLIKPHW
jgi:ABC-type multidrug transport system permease subunit